MKRTMGKPSGDRAVEPRGEIARWNVDFFSAAWRFCAYGPLYFETADYSAAPIIQEPAVYRERGHVVEKLALCGTGDQSIAR